jgi:hypothetical protein
MLQLQSVALEFRRRLSGFPPEFIPYPVSGTGQALIRGGNDNYGVDSVSGTEWRGEDLEFSQYLVL